MRHDLDRCDRELAEIATRPDVRAGEVPAWIVAMGQLDWQLERLLIARESEDQS